MVLAGLGEERLKVYISRCVIYFNFVHLLSLYLLYMKNKNLCYTKRVPTGMKKKNNTISE